MSPDLRVMLSPSSAYRALAPQAAGTTLRAALARPVLVAVVIGCTMAISATGRITIGLALSSILCWSFAPALQMLTGARLLTPRTGDLGPAARMDLWFMGHAPWSLWMLASAAIFTWSAETTRSPVENRRALFDVAVAFAGWLVLMVTALNLLPIGQLDGGHIAYAMFGHRIGNVVSTVAMWSLVLLAIFVWPGLTMWAILIFFIAGTAVPPLNDLTPLTPGRTALGYAALAILLLILMPLSHALWSAAGLR